MKNERTWRQPDRQVRLNAVTEGQAFISKPKKGEGDFRHCYVGQEANLLATLREKKMTLEEFNHALDLGGRDD